MVAVTRGTVTELIIALVVVVVVIVLARSSVTVEKAFWQNAKIVVPADGQLVNVIGDLAGVAPVPVKPAHNS